MDLIKRGVFSIIRPFFENEDEDYNNHDPSPENLAAEPPADELCTVRRAEQVPEVKNLEVRTERPSVDKEFLLNLSWEAMELKEELLYGINSKGLKEPSKIQEACVIPIILGIDTILQAQSGAGKTAALIIGTLQQVDSTKLEPQILVLAPTRDLAIQIGEAYKSFGRNMEIQVATCVDGKLDSINEKYCQVIVGTPDHVATLAMGDLSSNTPPINFQGVKTLALDEIDALHGRFWNYIVWICQTIPVNTQVICMSTTIPRSLLQTLKLIMRPRPMMLLCPEEDLISKRILQFYLEVRPRGGRFKGLVSLLQLLCSDVGLSKGIVFCQNPETVKLPKKLKKARIGIPYVFARKNPPQGDEVMEDFRRPDGARILVSSNHLSRGIDLEHVNFVINYDVPTKCADYIHRVGRACRYGRKGLAVTLLTNHQICSKGSLERFGSTTIKPLPQEYIAVRFHDILNVRETSASPVVIAASSPEEQPALLLEEKPALLLEEKPALVLEEKPALVLEEKPALVLEEKPALVLEEKPALVLEEQPASLVEEQPALLLEEQEVPGAEEDKDDNGADSDDELGGAFEMLEIPIDELC